MQVCVLKLRLEQTDASWKSYLYSLLQRVMSLTLWVFINCLPFFTSLKSLKTWAITHCSNCGNQGTLQHILNSCPVYLFQGCCTWQQNSVPQHLVLAYSSLNSPPQIFTDLPRHLSSTESTIPSLILPTSQRPDLALLFHNREMYVIALTTPFQYNLGNAHTRKHDHYASVISDFCFSSNFTCFFSLEAGSRGSY